ncbi:hypothetical protein MauCBS54593_001109 [Microsporum audouinii]
MLLVDCSCSRLSQPRCGLAEEDSLPPFPGLDAEEEEGGLDEDDAPFPGDARVAEDLVVDDGDVEQREDGDEARDDGPEEEPVAPDVVHPLRQVPRRARLHAEEAAAQVDHLPRQEERKPRQADERRRARPEDGVARRRVVAVAVRPQVAVAEPEHHQRERGQAERGHPEAVRQDVHDDLPGEDPLFLYR